MSFLRIENAAKSYGATEVLHDVDIEAEKGEFLVLVGPSGCGKSTLLNMIAGLEDITSGTISINGRVVNDVRPAQRNIAMVFQSYALYPNMSVAQNMAFGLEMNGVPRAERDRKVAEVAELLQITPLLKRRPGQLSGGQRQRVAMGRALVRSPDVFLFDEPLSNLDAKLRVEMRTEIKKLHRRLGVTIVYVTHDQIEALTMADKIAVMHKGLIQQFGAAKEIYDDPANMFVAGFMGSPSMNLFPARILSRDGAPTAAVALADGATAHLQFADDAMRAHEGRDVILGLRPEAITDPGGADHDSHAIRQIEAPVEVTEPAGSDTFVFAHFGGVQSVARFRADSHVRAGARTKFAVNMEKAVVFDPETGTRLR